MVNNSRITDQNRNTDTFIKLIYHELHSHEVQLHVITCTNYKHFPVCNSMIL